MNNGYPSRVDESGWVFLPPEIRSKMGILPGTVLQASIENGRIILSVSRPRCILCGRTDGVFSKYQEKHICAECINFIKKFY